MSEYRLLEKTVKWLTQNARYHVCIHDTSGVLHNVPSLQLPLKNSIHSCTFCDYAKITAEGMKNCLRCKSLSIKKADRVKETYIGHCYLGITEIIKPVFFNDKMVCVIYLGNLLLSSQKGQINTRIERVCSYTGINHQQLINQLSTVHEVDNNLLFEYCEIVELIGEYILLSLRNSANQKIKPNSTSPIYRSSNHWVIESLQNYASQYYNRDLRLSHLAKLYFLNPQYLCRLFKNETGTHFSDYVNKIRITNARHFLSISDSDIVDIALNVGFNNVTYFNRLFKKYTGLTPSEFRTLNKNTDKKAT